MNRAVKLNYLLIGVVGGMLAMWACGGDTMGGSSGGGARDANAQEPSDCKQWEVKLHQFDASGIGDNRRVTPPTIGEGEFPFAAVTESDMHLVTRTCVKE